MNPDPPRRSALLQKQVEILRAMSLVYREGQAAFAGRNLAAIQQQTTALDSLSRQFAQLNRQVAAQPASPSDAPWQRILAAERAEVRFLNAVFSCLARRSARNAAIRLNILAAASGGLISRASLNAPAPAGSFHTYV